MKKSDDKIDRAARSLVAQHGPEAALVAAADLNRCIDRGDWEGRDFWARIVHRVHEIGARLRAVK